MCLLCFMSLFCKMPLPCRMLCRMAVHLPCQMLLRCWRNTNKPTLVQMQPNDVTTKRPRQQDKTKLLQMQLNDQGNNIIHRRWISTGDQNDVRMPCARSRLTAGWAQNSGICQRTSQVAQELENLTRVPNTGSSASKTAKVA